MFPQRFAVANYSVLKQCCQILRMVFSLHVIQLAIERAITFSKSITDNVKINPVIENIKNNN